MLGPSLAVFEYSAWLRDLEDFMAGLSWHELWVASLSRGILSATLEIEV